MFNMLRRLRQGNITVLSAVLMVVMIGMIAFALDLGFIALTRSQLQNAVDSSALAAGGTFNMSPDDIRQTAIAFGNYNQVGGGNLGLQNSEIKFGIWDVTSRTFTELTDGSRGNAVRVEKSVDRPLFFGRVFGNATFSPEASATVMANPRDICFVVDLSGSMNDDTEPCWATPAINTEFGPAGYPNVGNNLMTDVYSDFGYGTFPGTLQYVGAPLGVTSDKYAYAEMTKNGGVLSQSSIPSQYRIQNSNSESTRKTKAYKWMIKYQIAVVMPNATPDPNQSQYYTYWSKYLDYIMDPEKIAPPSKKKKKKKGGGGGGGGGPSPPPVGMVDPYDAEPEGIVSNAATDLFYALKKPQPILGHGSFSSWLFASSPGTPPTNRGWLPPSQDGDRIHKFNNPNSLTFPSAPGVWGYRNKIGYRTYVQFMMDHGRDLKPDGTNYVPLSVNSPLCPRHSESTPGGSFNFPPRSQPMHAMRRALIAAMQVVKDNNNNIPDINHRDWVSVVTFDKQGLGAQVVQSVTGDYDAAMVNCVDLQAVGDKNASTATEQGLIAARNHIEAASNGGQGREYTNKVVVLLTDGVPNQVVSSNSDIDNYMSANSNPDFYGGGYYWLDAPLMQSHQLQAKRWQVFPVGVGLGTDYDFMDRMARMGDTANDNGESPRGSGNPAEYEARTTEIFTDIITNPRVRLVD